MDNTVNSRSRETAGRASTPDRVRIAVLGYDGCLGMQVFGLVDVLRMAAGIERSLGQPARRRLEVEICSAAGGTVVLAGGATVQARRLRGRPDLLVVPGFVPGSDGAPAARLSSLEAEMRAIRRTFASGAGVASICTGAFLLGQAGLLDGRAVTTSWVFGAQLRSAFPSAIVRTDAVLLEDGGVITTGAVSAANDLALQLIKRYLGAAVASATANASLLPGIRSDQRPFVDPRLTGAESSTFSARLRDWFGGRLTEPYGLTRVAAAFKVSPRTLMRRVKKETGGSPLTMLQQLRVDEAKRLLAGSRQSLEQVTEAVGYVDAITFSRLFARMVGETPAQYRRRAGSLAKS